MGQDVDYSRLAKLSISERLAAVCLLFDSQWKTGKAPELARYLFKVPSAERPALLTRLVDLDVLHRRSRGEEISAADYVDRYPHDSEDLRAHLKAVADSDDAGLYSTHTFQSQQASQVPDISEIIPSEKLAPFLTPPPIKKLGRYVLSKELGKGGFGQVFLALDPELGRSVAIKTMLKHRVKGPDSEKGFLDEARKVAQLNHGGIVQVYDVGCDHNQYYIVSELIPGGTLGELLKGKRFKWNEAASLVADIADARHFAHLRNIVHRDLKPQNILIDALGKPRIADFGLAVTEEEQLRESGGALGTYAYMPPEVMRGGCNFADSRSDIYSLGSILYQLLTDRLLFTAKTREEWRPLVLDQAPKTPTEIDDRIPLEIERICLKCLSKNAADRYTTAQDLASELREFVQSTAVVGMKSNRHPTAAGWNWRDFFWGYQWGAFFCLVLAAIGISVSLRLFFNFRADKDLSHRRLSGHGVTGESEPAELTDPDSFPSVSELGLVEGPLDRWTKALIQPPKIMQFPVDRRNSNIRYVRKSAEIFLSCNKMALLEIGETNAPHFDMQVALKQNAWEGGIGLFLGYRAAPEHGPSYRHCYFLFLTRTERNARPQLDVILSSSLLDQNGEMISETKKTVIKGVPLQEFEQILKFEIRNHRLHAIAWGVKSAVLPTTDEVHGEGQPSFSGRFGLYLSGAAGHFRNAHIRILSTDAAKQVDSLSKPETN